MKKTLMFLISLSFLMMPCASFAQQDKGPGPGDQALEQQKSAPDQKMMKKHCDHKMGEHHKMMKEMNARLDAKVAAMDAATGDKKVEAMADVIKEMVAQRKEMQEHMMKMGHKCMNCMAHKKHTKAQDKEEK